jgi:hypothetical protein
MKYGLEHLTKEQLIQITQMYMDDVDCLKNEVNKTVSAEEVVEILERVRVKGEIELI